MDSNSKFVDAVGRMLADGRVIVVVFAEARTFADEAGDSAAPAMDQKAGR